MAFVSNKYGRKRAIAIGYFWLVLGVALRTAAVNPVMFVLGSMIQGPVSAWFSVGSLLIAETAYPTHRSIGTALFNCGWFAGEQHHVL